MSEKMQNPLSESLSDLADGRASEQQLDALLRQWAGDEELRRDWQAVHLTGEALRSPDMAAPVQSSEQLLARLRDRIAQEPVVLRPKRSTRWLPPLGVAAGFVLLAMVMPRLFVPAAQPQLQLGERDPAQALVAVPAGGTLDSASSFVQTIVAPDQPGQVSPQAVQASQRLLSLPPPYAGLSAGVGASASMPASATSGAAMP